MFFSDFHLYKNTSIRHSLLWEYDMSNFDWFKYRQIVVQRVIERGNRDDFYAALNLYGMDSFKEAIKNIPSMHAKDASFVHQVFQIPLSELKCYTQKQQHPKHSFY